MNLTHTDVTHIARLARLALTEEELAHYQEQLAAILDYAARLNELDLSGVAPSAHAVARQNVLRDDIVTPSLPRDDALFNAAATAEGQFLIQAVLEE
ncbi:MAG: Asp-tRNA(Asn)/Glu-tRNA(Gln) amidotransferase subunit GatC [Candidatus Promineofilum sp.]|jgi:aspartyl-tRNA(Asn)/glutamyl-tRNA(Gln) amidotransferase subunit C|nr:Asp-tRNA(Asn)/Glu-tRNA(Gln) amidotransferase subunit GatC [Promineifilum sp.]